MANNKENLTREQIIPLALTLVVLAGLSVLLWFTVTALNLLPTAGKISPTLHLADVLVGVAVYLKTSVDFAIFMGRLMTANPGWKNRIAIEIGTALGNALGTILILILWIFFKEIHWLLAIMILLAALVLFELAYGGLEHFENWEGEGKAKRAMYLALNGFLSGILKLTRPLTSKILPDLGKKLNGNSGLPWKSLLWFAFTIPFLLGLDDFAGYVPLFSVVNVFGFSLGVLAAHTTLNIALFINPKKTTSLVRNTWISFLGTLAFIGLAVWGLVEVVKIFIR
jgi:hypothetical protein